MTLKINASTALYAIFGDPVSHSLSPVMHNAAFASLDYNAVYLAFKVKDIGRAVTGIKSLGIKAASITLPHKIGVLKHLDQIDETAQKIGAVNTVMNKNGILKGYNTDGLGAVNALEQKTKIKEKKIAIIGAGGAARAIGFELSCRGAKIIVFNRTIQTGERLARDIGADFRPINDFNEIDIEILINTTPLGMTPKVGQIPVEASSINKEMVVMDVVYNPFYTRLLKTASDKGCEIVNGVDMFVYQGAQQFKLWLRQDAPVELMKRVVMNALG